MAADDPRAPYPGDLVPRPDPTLLTSAAVREAREELRRELAGLREVIMARMDANDTQRTMILQIMDERRAEIQRRFEERDLRFNERDKDRREAVEVALSAAKELSEAHDIAVKEASGKFEASVQQQISQLAALAQANRDLLDGKIDSLKERIDRNDGSMSGAQGYRTERRLDISGAAGALIAFAALASVIIAIIAILK